MSGKRGRIFYRVYEVDVETGDEGMYAEAEAADPTKALAEARNYAAQIDADQSEIGQCYMSAIYKVHEIEERV